MAVRLSQRGRILPVLVASPDMSPRNAGIVTETRFEWVSGWDMITDRTSPAARNVNSAIPVPRGSTITPIARHFPRCWGVIPCARHPVRTRLAAGGREMDSNLYGAFPVKRLFWVVLTVFCSERERPFFVPSPAIRFAERAEGVKGPKR